MNESQHTVVIARLLLPAGREPLERRFDLVEGGLDADRTRLMEIVPGAAAIIADPTVPIDAEVLDAAGDQLKVVSNFAVGYDNVDVDACSERGIAVTNTPDVLTQATAELALTLTLAAARRISDAERDLRAGLWTGWDPGAYRGLELRGATVGVVGLGRIGGRYAEMVRALGADVVYAGQATKPEFEHSLGARHMHLDELLQAASVVSLHARASAENHHLIGRRELDLLGPGGVLVNTGRGSLVDSDALAAALLDGTLGAAGLDVYENEPHVPEALLDAPRCVLLPHIGSASIASRDAMAHLAAENVIAVLDGREPPSQVR
jgi:glyoxylate reductase